MNPSSPAARWTNRALFRLLWPLIVEQLLAVSIGMVDTVMVSAVGEAAVSGVSLVDAVNLLLITAFTALATGGAVVASQYLGRREAQNASMASRQLVYTITGVSLVLMVLTLVLRTGLLHLIYGHIAPEVMQNAETYLWLSALSYPFIALYNSGAAIFRSMGNSKVGMAVAFMVNLLNIGGNALLIFGFGMGVAGAAISTLISRAAAAVVLMWMLIGRSAGPISLKGLFSFKLDFEMIRRILKVGLPNGLENSMFQIGKLMVARIVSTFGTSAIAGNAIAAAVLTVCTLPGMSFGLAMLTVVGQCVGAGEYAAARRNTYKLMAGSYVSMAFFCLMVGLFRAPLLGLFNLSDEAVALAMQLLLVFCVMAPVFWSPSFALPNALRAAGDTRFSMLVSVFSMWTFRIGSALLFAYTLGYGVMGVWFAMVVDWIVRCGFFLVRWFRGKWQNIQVIS